MKAKTELNGKTIELEGSMEEIVGVLNGVQNSPYRDVKIGYKPKLKMTMVDFVSTRQDESTADIIRELRERGIADDYDVLRRAIYTARKNFQKKQIEKPMKKPIRYITRKYKHFPYQQYLGCTLFEFVKKNDDMSRDEIESMIYAKYNPPIKKNKLRQSIYAILSTLRKKEKLADKPAVQDFVVEAASKGIPVEVE